MNKTEAREILEEEINQLRQRSYTELRSYLGSKGVETKVVEGRSNTKYQIEIQAFWDDKPEKNLRVLVSIDNGGLRAFFPISDDFIIAPDGSFVGE